MNKLELWPSLDRAWHAAGSGKSGQVGDAHWDLIQDKSRTRMLRFRAPGRRPLVLKIYATPAHLSWRTLGLASRANREFTLMMSAFLRDLPLAQPSYWLDQRVMGGLRFSAIALNVIEGNDLETHLRRPKMPRSERARLARQTGDLLGRLHRAGVYWATAAPRNLMLNPDGAQEPLLAIDFPYATLARQSIVGSDEALLDLACVLRMRNGDLAFDGEDRQSLVLAYCDNNSEAARILDERIVLRHHHSWRLRRLKQRLRNLFLSSSSSAGSGGRFLAATGTYEQLKGSAVFLTD